MAHNLFFGIGVAQPDGMPSLPGVDVAMTAMIAWAERQGYDERVVIDDSERASAEGPKRERVTAERIKEALKLALAKGPFDRIVVYFVGHGFFRRPDQIWILSNGPNLNTGRISMSALRGGLQTYRPAQIALISDACQELGEFASGEVSVLDDNPSTPRRVYVDTLQAALRGKPAHAFDKGPQDRFCLFSKVLSEFLMGQDERAFELLDNTRLNHVSSQTLYAQLPDAVMQAAAELQVNQEPELDIGFPQNLDVYSTFPAAPPRPPPRPPGVDFGMVGNGGPARFESLRPRRDPPPRREPPPSLEMRLAKAADTPGPSFEPIDWKATPATVAVVQPSRECGVIAFLPGPMADRPLWFGRAGSDRPAQVGGRDGGVEQEGALRKDGFMLVEIHDQQPLALFVPIYDRLCAQLLIDNRPAEDTAPWRSARGCVGMNWVDRQTGAAPPDVPTGWLYLNALLAGALRASDIPVLADSLRHYKHLDPMLGIICAYLYDQVGDLESLARLCHYYQAHHQAIPFDIALLARARFERGETGRWRAHYSAAPEDEQRRKERPNTEYLWAEVPAGSYPVAGTTPLLRAGWSRLSQLQDRVFDELGRLSEHLTGSPIATLAGPRAVHWARDLLHDFP